MSIEAVTWSLTVPVGGNAKVVLLGLANHAHPDGSEAYPSLDTLATYAHCDRSTARRNVRKLLEDGWIREDGNGPRGQIKYQLAMGDPFTTRGGKTPPAAESPLGGGTSAPEGVAPAPPEPSIEPSTEPSTSGTRAQGVEHKLPDDLPDHLHQPAIEAARILYRAARARGQRRPVMLEAVGSAVARYPTKDHVELAGRVEHWLCWGNGQNKPCRDIVARFRDWLPDAPEARVPDGSPLTTAVASPGVTPLFGRGMANVDRVQATVDRLSEMERQLSG